MADGARPRACRFGDFVLDLSAYELRRQGRRLRIERQPMELLRFLVERHGELVTREEIVERLWGRDVFVAVDTSVNTVVRKIRRALRDSADTPRFIQTIQGKGYRFIADLDRPTVAVVAVLPFDNLQSDADHDYVAEGLTEETIVRLGQVAPDELRVVGRRSCLAYRGTQTTLDVIGRELGADYILEGSVRTAGGRCRVATTLCRVKDQVPVWAETFERDTNDLLRLQADLGQAIAHQIQRRLVSRLASPPSERQTGHATAYDLYLRGRHHFNQMTPATAVRALDCFRRATEIDPTYALAWAGLADVHAGRLLNNDTAPSDVAGHARLAATRAIEHGTAVPEAHIAIARVHILLDWAFADAERHLRRALALDPSSTEASWVLARALSHQARHAEALEAALRGRELDPFNALSLSMLAQTAFSARDFDAALRYAKEALSVEPDYWVAHYQLAQALEAVGLTDAALTALADAGRLSGENSKPLALSAYVLGRAGRVDEARSVVSVLERRSRERYTPPLALALSHAGLGDDARVVEWLEKALEARDVHLIYVPGDAKWDRCRSDPRFQAVMDRCGFSEACRTPRPVERPRPQA
jgi:TolB-like protein/tetratricopeptide (TPR) repeat protein